MVKFDCFLAASALWSGWSLWAQGDPVPSWVSVAIQGGSFTLIAYLIVMGLPALQKEMNAERKAERDAFTAALNGVATDRKEERAEFAASLREITESARREIEAVRAAARQEVETLRQTFQSEQRETRQFYTAESEAMRKVYFDAVGAWRSAVHDIKDAAGAAVNKAQVAIEVSRANR